MAKITLTEDKLKNIVAESVKRVLNEISSDMLDRATVAAQEKGRVKQMRNFKYAANEKRSKELFSDYNEDTCILYSNINAQKDFCRVQDNKKLLTVYADGRVTVGEMHTFSSDPNSDLVSWPLDYDKKMSSKISVQLARTLVKWCNKYLTPEGKEKLQGFDDWHNWVQL